MRDAERTQRWIVLAAWASVLLVYVLSLLGMPRHVFWSPDEGSRLLQAKTLRFDDGFSHALPYPGERLDPDLRFYAHRRGARIERSLYPVRDGAGAFHFHWAPWFPLLSRLPLELFGVTGVYVLPLLAGWLTAVLSGRLAAAIDPSLEVPAVLVVGLATPIYFYSLCFWEHTVAAALSLCAVLLFARRGGTPSALIACLPALAAAVLLRLETVALVLAIAVATAACALSRGAASGRLRTGKGRREYRRGALLLGAACALLVAFALSLPQRQLRKVTRLPERVGRLARQPGALAEILINAPRNFGPALPSGMMGVAGAALVTSAVAPFVGRVRVEGLMTLAALSASLAVSASLVATPQRYRCLHGLVPIAPFLIFAPYAVPVAWRRRSAPLFVVAAVGILYLLSGTAAVFMNSVDRWGRLTQGLQWGPRYLLPLYPILTVLALAGVHEYWQSSRPGTQKTIAALLLALLVAAGFLLERRGVHEAGRIRGALAAWQAALERGVPVVTDLWWLPAGLADFYAREEVYVVRSRREVAEWSGLARAGGVERFTFVSQSRIDGERLAGPRFAPVPGSSRVVSGAHMVDFTAAPRGEGSPGGHTP